MAKIAKKVLTRNGIQYFDAGGNVLPVQSTTSGGFLGIPGALTAQSGYQATLAPTDYTSYGGTINPAATSALGGNAQFGQNANEQQALITALNNTAQGQGPNPAQAALNQATGQNINAQAALMAGQRGTSANAGNLARNIAEQGATTQQQAAGQGATLQAQQELGAQQAALQGEQGLGSEITGEQNANTGLFTGASGAQNTQNTGSINNYSQAQGINAQTAANNANATNKTGGGLLNGIAGAIGSIFAKGGIVMPEHFREMAKIYHAQKMADGGMIQIPNFITPQTGSDDTDATATKLGSTAGKGIKSLFTPSALGNINAGGVSSTLPLAGDAGEGGLADSAAILAANGGEAFSGKVPGQAKVKGNSYSNDTVPALLSPKEIVLPRSVTMAEDAPEKAREFVAKLQEKYQGQDEDDFRSALKKAMSTRRAA